MDANIKIQIENLFRIAIIAILSMFFLGCGTMAVIKKADGSIAEGTIRAGDKKNIYIETMRGEDSVKRVDIAEIEHPGKILMIAGGGATALGLITGISATVQMFEDVGSGDEVSAGSLIFPYTLLVGGPTALIIGVSHHFTSKNNMHKPKWVREFGKSYFILPQYVYSRKEDTYGLFLLKQF